MTTAQEQDVTAPPDRKFTIEEPGDGNYYIRDEDGTRLVAGCYERQLIAANAALTAENKALREAVHGLCFTNHGRRITCELCGGEFDAAEPERHAPGCLAAGAANER